MTPYRLPIIICLAVLLGALPTESEAWSKKAQWFFRPHIGVMYQYVSADLEEDQVGRNAFIDYENYFEDAYHGYNIYFGARIHKRIGFEVSYFQTGEESVDAEIIPVEQGGLGYAATVDSEINGWNYDLMYFYRFNKRWEGILSLGYADWDIDVTAHPGEMSEPDSVTLTSGDDTFFRYGAGFNYDVSKRLKIRAMAYYLDSDFVGLDIPWTAAIGAHLAF